MCIAITFGLLRPQNTKKERVLIKIYEQYNLIRCNNEICSRRFSVCYDVIQFQKLILLPKKIQKYNISLSLAYVSFELEIEVLYHGFDCFVIYCKIYLSFNDF